MKLKVYNFMKSVKEMRENCVTRAPGKPLRNKYIELDQSQLKKTLRKMLQKRMIAKWNEVFWNIYWSNRKTFVEKWVNC